MSGDPTPEIDLHTDRAHSARVYDYLLGGKDNYAVDRAVADAVVRADPHATTGVRLNRLFMHRVARFLAVEHGVRQFLDLGTGIPTQPNLHEVVQAVAPDARIVYVDNDPIVLAHARALMTSTPEGRTAYVDADLRDPSAVLATPAVVDTLDLTRPVAVLVLGMIQYVDDADATALITAVREAVPPGSWLVMSVLTGDFDPVAMAGVQAGFRSSGQTCELRTKAQTEELFAGWELVEGGLTPVQYWRPDPTDVGRYSDTDAALWGGIARKP